MQANLYNYNNQCKILLDKMVKMGLKLTTGESFTGGSLVYSFIELAGASEVIDRSFVVYSDKAKNEVLGVSLDVLNKYSAVSEEVCSQMLEGLYEKTRADICIATTGYAGSFDDIGKDEDGHIFFGIMYKGKKYIFEHRLLGKRNQVIKEARNLIYKELMILLDL